MITGFLIVLAVLATIYSVATIVAIGYLRAKRHNVVMRWELPVITALLWLAVWVMK